MHRLADAFAIPSERVDGMDVLAVYEAMGRAVEHTRGGGPFFLEAITYRFRGHSMADPVAYRDKAEEEVWKKKDPITRYGAELLGSGAAFTEKRAGRDQGQSVEDEDQRGRRASPTRVLGTGPG